MTTDFSLHLNEDQIQLQKWIHDFAEDVIRPAAHEWDEREEFPWPVVEEAAHIGLYGTDFLMNAMTDHTGITLPMAIEEIFWGDGGIGMAIMGSALAAAGIVANGTPEQTMEWVPQCYGTHDKVQLGAFCVSEPDAGSDDEKVNNEVLAQVAPQVPLLLEMMEEIVHEDPDGTIGWCDDEKEFTFGLDLLLDGLEERRKAAAAG